MAFIVVLFMLSFQIVQYLCQGIGLSKHANEFRRRKKVNCYIYMHKTPTIPFMAFRASSLALLLLLLVSMSHWGSTRQTDPPSVESGFELAAVALYALINDGSLNQDAFRYAFRGYLRLREAGLVTRDKYLTIIDYSLPSTQKRLFLIDMDSASLVCKCLMAHGRNSGGLYARHFSNRLHSHQSALGFYLTGETYQGGHGYSLLLNGVDTGFNETARARAIVIHGAGYVSDDYIRKYGRLGRSWGCPSLPPGLNAGIIDRIKEGSVLFAYYPDAEYLEHALVLGSFRENMRVPDRFVYLAAINSSRALASRP
jgi:hypothetical protein